MILCRKRNKFCIGSYLSVPSADAAAVAISSSSANVKGMQQKPLWTQFPIPFWMTMRGLLPKWLGGEMIYEAVIRTNHFPNPDLLLDYLLSQQMAASIRCEHTHVVAIDGHIKAILAGLRAERAKLVAV